MGDRKRRRTWGAVGAAGLALAIGVPTAGAAPSAPSGPSSAYGSGAVAYTRSDTTTVEHTEPFAAPGRTPLIGDFAGPDTVAGNLDDVFWYTPGTGGDELWKANGDRTWSASAAALSVKGSYTPLVGAFTADGKDDIFWYAPGPAPDSLWDFNPDGTITRSTRNVTGVYTPVVGHFSDDAGDDIIWYGQGNGRDAWWDFDGTGSFVDRPYNVLGGAVPIVGDFGGGTGDPDGIDDILYYRPGRAADRLVTFHGDGQSRDEVSVYVNGTYTPIVGDFDGDGADDVIWYAPGTAADSIWTFDGAYEGHTTLPIDIDGTGTPIAANFFDQAAHQTDVLFWGKGSKPDAIWDFTSGSVPTVRAVTLPGDITPAVGEFDVIHGPGADILNRTS